MKKLASCTCEWCSIKLPGEKSPDSSLFGGVSKSRTDLAPTRYVSTIPNSLAQARSVRTQKSEKEREKAEVKCAPLFVATISQTWVSG